jgi:hypothetical protein
MAEIPDNYQQLLEMLLDHEWLQTPADGIARRAIDKGVESLTDNQRSVLDRYAFEPFGMFDPADIIAISENGYDGTNSKVLAWAQQVKQDLGYIPDDDSPSGDIGYAEAAKETYGF